MQGDREGKHDHCMQIPITIGSDPTRETSFIGNDEGKPYWLVSCSPICLFKASDHEWNISVFW